MLHDANTLVGESQNDLSPPVNGTIPFERTEAYHPYSRGNITSECCATGFSGLSRYGANSPCPF